MKNRILTTFALVAASAVGSQLGAQEGPEIQAQERPTFDLAADALQEQLDASLAELAALRASVADERVQLGERLRERESERIAVREEYDAVARSADVTAQRLLTLNEDIKRLRDDSRALENLFLDYARNFDSRVNIAEKQRYQERINAALFAPDDANLTESEVFQRQAEMLFTGFERLEESLGGVRFPGRAVDPNGLFDDGTFLVIGPMALFQSADGSAVGLVEHRAGSNRPTVLGLDDAVLEQAAAAIVTGGGAMLPVDPTLGNALKVAQTETTVLEEIEKGGPVMYPIFALASAALLVALFKGLGMFFVRRPSRKQQKRLRVALAEGDEAAARSAVHNMRGPGGRMLAQGVDNIGQPRDLVEEVMYESVLTARLRLNRGLPFIAISAASAPLLGLLGTVSGIINTFKMIVVQGSGDVKSLSGGISEALITTKYGLIVAIPSLLLHAFLSRKARGIVGEMETAAVSFVNNLSKSSLAVASPQQRPISTSTEGGSGAPDPAVVRRQVSEVLNDMLGPLADEVAEERRTKAGQAN